MSETLIEGMPDSEAAPIVDRAVAAADVAVSAALRLLHSEDRVHALMEHYKAGLSTRTGRIDQAALYAALARRVAHAEALPASAVVLPFRPRP